MTLRAFLHQEVWRRLPRSGRRAALFRITKAFAPRCSVDAVASMPIVVAGTFATASGLGEGARLCYAAIKQSGLPVYGIDLTDALMQPRDFGGRFEYADGRALVGPGTLILHVNSPLVPLAMRHIGAQVVKKKRIIGYWAWELPSTPPDWQYGVPFVHEIWTSSSFTAAAFEGIAGERPVRVLTYPIAAQGRESGSSASRGRVFTVVSVFNMASGYSRKNPLAVIRAFRAAFDGNPEAQLILKCSNGDCYEPGLAEIRSAISGATNIQFLTDTVTPEQLGEIYDRADVLLSLHRSEGFGLTLAEAMFRGILVIATDWSGSRDFLSPSVGIPVPYGLVPARDPQGTYEFTSMVWAEPDVRFAAQALRDCFDRKDILQGLRQPIQAYAEYYFSQSRYVETVADLLDCKAA